MAFIRHRGKTKIMFFNGDTALEWHDGSLVELTDSATIGPVDNDCLDRVVGVARRTDTIDHDTTQLVPVEVPVENAVEWLIDVDSDAGAVDSDVGTFVAVDTVGGNSVNAGDSTATRIARADTAPARVLITGIISASKVRGVLVNTIWGYTNDTNDTE